MLNVFFVQLEAEACQLCRWSSKLARCCNAWLHQMAASFPCELGPLCWPHGIVDSVCPSALASSSTLKECWYTLGESIGFKLVADFNC